MTAPKRHLDIVLDCQRAAPLARFWAVALGWEVRPYDEAEVSRLAALGLTPETDPSVAVDHPDGTMTLWLDEVPEPKQGKNRMHLDIRVRDSAHLEELLSLGARVLARQSEWWTLADPEGNEFDVMEPPGTSR
ncbi:VOC family protein [Streptomyces boninensis]|uniref:VOC family protein n=1 Tax=Streptomyces boninensis TaxID=2039455 RepID=UPI003B216B6C